MSEQTVEDFRSGFAQAADLEPAEAPPDTVENADPTTEQDGPARDDAGRFAAKAESDAETAGDDPDADTDTQTAEEVLLAGKFKTAEELERGYEEIQRRFRERDDEIGALRKISEQFEALREETGQPAQQAYDPDSLDDLFANKPHEIPAYAQWAIDNADAVLYDKAIQAWNDLDPTGALTFVADKIADAKIAALREELAPQQAAAKQAQTATAFADAYTAKQKQHPDFDAVLNGVTDATLEGIPPEVLAGLQTGDQASKERCLETLYRWTKAEQAGTLQAATQEAAAEAQNDGQAAKLAATVATTTATGDRTAVSGVDAWRTAFHESDAFKKAAGQT